MPVGIIKPSNQIKHTNIATVRMKKGKKRFEIACYKNKVMDFRKGLDKDLDNILQTRDIYSNMGRGEKASMAEVRKSWPKDKFPEEDDIIKDILQHGEFQVGEKERNAELERVRHEVIDIVTSKIVDPKSKRLYTSGMVEKALDQLSSQSQNPDKAKDPAAENGAAKHLPRWTGVVATKDAKVQALAAITALVAHQPIPVMRARMRLRVTCPVAITKHTVKVPQPKSFGEATEGEQPKAKGVVKDIIISFFEETESQETNGAEWEITGFADPGQYKPLGEFLGSQTKGQGNVIILDTAIVHEDA